jgi:hypothetical protein
VEVPVFIGGFRLLFTPQEHKFSVKARVITIDRATNNRDAGCLNILYPFNDNLLLPTIISETRILSIIFRNFEL